MKNEAKEERSTAKTATYDSVVITKRQTKKSALLFF